MIFLSTYKCNIQFVFFCSNCRNSRDIGGTVYGKNSDG